MMNVDIQEMIKRIIRYLIEGGAVALAAYYIPQKKMDLKEVAMIAITAAAVFAVLDMYAPSIASAARQGAGFGIGAAQVGYTGVSVPAM